METNNSVSSELDPLFKPITDNSVSKPSKAATLKLLNEAFAEPKVQQIYSQKLEHRPLSLNPAEVSDARDARRQERLSKLKNKRKPKPLSAKEKRELRIFEIPKAEITCFPSQSLYTHSSYEKFMILNHLWNKYISEIILYSSSHESATAVNGPTLLKADYHGSLMRIEDCRCTSRIGITGICVKETKKMFEIVTKEDRLVKIPKEKSLFRVCAKVQGSDASDNMEWRLWGDQFLLRSGERAGRKFNGRTIRGKALLEL